MRVRRLASGKQIMICPLVDRIRHSGGRNLRPENVGYEVEEGSLLPQSTLKVAARTGSQSQQRTQHIAIKQSKLSETGVSYVLLAAGCWGNKVYSLTLMHFMAQGTPVPVHSQSCALSNPVLPAGMSAPPLCSSTTWVARSRTSGEHLTDLLITPSQEMESPVKLGWFTPLVLLMNSMFSETS